MIPEISTISNPTVRYPCCSLYLVSRYQAIEFNDLMSDLNEANTNTLARDCVKCSSVDSAPEDMVTLEVEENCGFTRFSDGGGGVVGMTEPAGNTV